MGKTTVEQIEAYVRQQASADHVPGTAVGIVEGSRPVLLSGFGDASANTSFFLGSSIAPPWPSAILLPPIQGAGESRRI